VRWLRPPAGRQRPPAVASNRAVAVLRCCTAVLLNARSASYGVSYRVATSCSFRAARSGSSRMRLAHSRRSWADSRRQCRKTAAGWGTARRPIATSPPTRQGAHPLRPGRSSAALVTTGAARLSGLADHLGTLVLERHREDQIGRKHLHPIGLHRGNTAGTVQTASSQARARSPILTSLGVTLAAFAPFDRSRPVPGHGEDQGEARGPTSTAR